MTGRPTKEETKKSLVNLVMLAYNQQIVITKEKVEKMVSEHVENLCKED